jgi:hypothetical protein
MRTFKTMAAQGDFIIIKVNSIPDNVEVINPEKGKIVVAHSETGHNHVMEAERVTAYKTTGTKDVDLYEMFLSVSQDTPIEHQRSFDTHESIMVPAGNYIVKRQREYTPLGFRKAAD